MRRNKYADARIRAKEQVKGFAVRKGTRNVVLWYQTTDGTHFVPDRQWSLYLAKRGEGPFKKVVNCDTDKQAANLAVSYQRALDQLV